MIHYSIYDDDILSNHSPNQHYCKTEYPNPRQNTVVYAPKLRGRVL